MFGNMWGHDDASSSYFIGPDADGESYWANQAERHHQHRRSLIALLVAIGAILLLALIIHPTLAWCAVFLLPFVALEWWLARCSRPTSKIPDYRPPDPVEITLDDTRG